MNVTIDLPYRPGIIGRVVRAALGVLCIQLAASSLLALAAGVDGLPAETGFWIGVAIAAWLTPVVFDIGLNRNLGNRWRVAVLVATGIAAAVGTLVSSAGEVTAAWLLVWITLTMGWLGISFLIAALIRTPGCEMRAFAHLGSLVGRSRDAFVACPGPLQPLDEWEHRTTGRAKPYPPQ